MGVGRDPGPRWGDTPVSGESLRFTGAQVGHREGQEDEAPVSPGPTAPLGTDDPADPNGTSTHTPSGLSDDVLGGPPTGERDWQGSSPEDSCRTGGSSEIPRTPLLCRVDEVTGYEKGSTRRRGICGTPTVRWGRTMRGPPTVGWGRTMRGPSTVRRGRTSETGPYRVRSLGRDGNPENTLSPHRVSTVTGEGRSSEGGVWWVDLSPRVGPYMRLRGGIGVRRKDVDEGVAHGAVIGGPKTETCRLWRKNSSTTLYIAVQSPFQDRPEPEGGVGRGKEVPPTCTGVWGRTRREGGGPS